MEQEDYVALKSKRIKRGVCMIELEVCLGSVFIPKCGAMVHFFLLCHVIQLDNDFESPRQQKDSCSQDLHADHS